jgi:hypothetical protein
MSWASFWGGVFTTLSFGIVGAGLWQHDPFLIFGLLPAACALGFINAACNPE